MSTMPTVPYIPDNAPFSPAQRAWLNGFLAGLWSSAPGPQPAAAAATRDVAVLFGSQTGTGERLAKKMAKELKAKGHTARIASLEGYTPAALASEQYAVILASTYGEGDPPDAVKPFFTQLCDDSAPRLEKLSYSVLALGDSHYEHFCKFGVDLDERLGALGAKRLAAPVTSDVDVDAAFEAWKTSLLERLASSEAAAPAAEAKALPAAAAPVPSIFHRDNPFRAALKDRRVLTQDVSSKQTLHLAFSLEGSDLKYEAGDALAIVPSNDPALVEDLLACLHLSGEEPVEIPKLGTRGIRQALTQDLGITRLSRKMVDLFARAGNVTALHNLLKPEQQTHLDTYMYDRGPIDLLHEYPGILTGAQQLADLLARLAVRLYSISSSPRAHAGEVHATVAVVRYRSHNRERGGVCSTLFADRIDPGGTLPVYIQGNTRFRLPADPAAPIIMVGPGTGIAPFRGFLHERAATGATGGNWLFFGERSAATDFLYRDELEALQSQGTLTRLDTAFSRDQAHKIYVQDRMLEQGKEFYAWLEGGATFYICGDASRMAKDVDAALHTLIEQHGGHSPDAAREYVQNLHESKRYLRDVY